MNIRPATQNDTFLLSSLCTDVQRMHADHYPQLFKMPQQDDFAESFFAEMLENPLVTVYIAEDGSQALGYVLCRLVEQPENVFTYLNRYLLIDQISVRPDEQRSGIGTMLLKQVQLHAAELGISKLQLNSWDFNLEAHAFFEKYGFKKFNYRYWLNNFPVDQGQS